jgi:hypothetical protein
MFLMAMLATPRLTLAVAAIASPTLRPASHCDPTGERDVPVDDPSGGLPEDRSPMEGISRDR